MSKDKHSLGREREVAFRHDVDLVETEYVVQAEVLLRADIVAHDLGCFLRV